MRRATLETLCAARQAGRPVALATHLDSGTEAVLDPSADRCEIAGMDMRAAARDALAADRPALVETESGRIFLNVFNPPLRLVLVGAVHIAQALAPMARIAGYDVTIIDPRAAFADAARFGDIRLVADWPDDVLGQSPPDSRTAVVTLTHDPKIDDAALMVALRSSAFYIGSLGSRKTHAARVQRLAADGVDAETIARIHGPVGLKLGGRAPEDIAISILAQMTQVLRGGGHDG